MHAYYCIAIIRIMFQLILIKHKVLLLPPKSYIPRNKHKTPAIASRGFVLIILCSRQNT